MGLLMYALLLVALRKPSWQLLEGDHRKGNCRVLPRQSQCEMRLAGAGAWTLPMTAEQLALGHIDWLRQAEGAATRSC